MEGPNTGACLFRDGVLLAMAEEERFIRVKRASEKFPSQSLQYCLTEAGVRLRDIAVVAVAWDHDCYPDEMSDFMRTIPGRERDPLADRVETIIHNKLAPDLARFTIEIALRKIDAQAAPEVRWYPHHLCHAASVHYMSGFESSSVLVMDGSGENVATTWWAGEGDSLDKLDEWRLPDSLGWFYASITEWLGFSAYSGEGKVMGLAAYGKPDSALTQKLEQFCIPDEDRIYRVDPGFVYYGPRSHSRQFTDKLVDLLGPPRLPEDEITECHLDVAHNTQARLEAVAMALATGLIDRIGSGNLCISGGVAMNCKMNGALSKLPCVERVFINPASHDSGTALGAALLAGRDHGVSSLNTVLTHAYWGPSFSDDEIEQALRHCGLAYGKCGDVALATAELLNQGKIVGWFQGRAEFGARALGGRSILANPMRADMKEVINARVKYREAFRPFAPSMIEEVKTTYMVEPEDSPFMILAYPFKEDFRASFPSVVHVDGSVRPQTVSRDTNPLYWELIDKFGKLSGHPIILNTSFNVRGEPIVNSPLDAIRCFYSTGMDALAIGSFLLTKDASEKT